MLEDALRRCLALDKFPTPSLSLLHWVVTGTWPDPVVRVDVVFHRPARRRCSDRPQHSGGSQPAKADPRASIYVIVFRSCAGPDRALRGRRPGQRRDRRTPRHAAASRLQMAQTLLRPAAGRTDRSASGRTAPEFSPELEARLDPAEPEAHGSAGPVAPRLHRHRPEPEVGRGPHATGRCWIGGSRLCSSERFSHGRTARYLWALVRRSMGYGRRSPAGRRGAGRVFVGGHRGRAHSTAQRRQPGRPHLARRRRWQRERHHARRLPADQRSRRRDREDGPRRVHRRHGGPRRRRRA